MIRSLWREGEMGESKEWETPNDLNVTITPWRIVSSNNVLRHFWRNIFVTRLFFGHMLNSAMYARDEFLDAEHLYQRISLFSSQQEGIALACQKCRSTCWKKICEIWESVTTPILMRTYTLMAIFTLNNLNNWPH